MVLTIGRTEVECESFRVRGAYSTTVARLFALPVAVASKEPLTLEVTIKGNKFKPYKSSKRVYWNKKHVGFFVLSNVSQEWDGDKYRTKLELKQSETLDSPDGDIPAYKWRHDLRALSENLPETDGAKIESGRAIEPFANSWKLGTNEVANDADTDVSSPAVLPVSRGGTGSFDATIALTNLGGISSASKGLPFGVAPLGADGKISALYLPAGGGGGGSGGGSVTYPITVGQGGTGALDAATARANLGAASAAEFADYIPSIAIGVTVAPLGAGNLVPFAFLPAYPTLSSLGGVASATYTSGLASKLDASARSAANGVAPLGADNLVPSSFLPAYPTLSSLGGVASATYTSGLASKLDASARSAANGVAPLGADNLVPSSFLSNNVSYTNVAQNNTALKQFSDGLYATNISPKIDTQNTGLSRNGVNLSAPSQNANQRQARVNYGTNGNVQIQVLSDDATTILFQWEFTASGNMLVPGVMRFAGYTSNPTGATFVPGAIYYHNTLKRLVYSDGTNWFQLTVGSQVA